jgi:hypothetical protein
VVVTTHNTHSISRYRHEAYIFSPTKVQNEKFQKP